MFLFGRLRRVAPVSARLVCESLAVKRRAAVSSLPLQWLLQSERDVLLSKFGHPNSFRSRLVVSCETQWICAVMLKSFAFALIPALNFEGLVWNPTSFSCSQIQGYNHMSEGKEGKAFNGANADEKEDCERDRKRGERVLGRLFTARLECMILNMIMTFALQTCT